MKLFKLRINFPFRFHDSEVGTLNLPHYWWLGAGTGKEQMK
jgi:hypothetical protein